MKTRHLLPLFATFLCAGTVATAAENESVFLPSQGKLVIPRLNLGSEIFYVQLDRTSPSAYNFDLNLASVLKITPQPGDDWATATEVVGDWVPDGLTGITLSFEADGTYRIDTPAEDDCPAGPETGTYTLDEDTGVIFFTTLTDLNGECGLSHPDGATRVARDGANLVVTLYEEGPSGQQVSTDITLLPN